MSLYMYQVTLELEKVPDLMSSHSDVTSVLKTLSLRLINEQREELALKLHYLSYLIELAHNYGTDAVIKKYIPP